LPRRRRRCRPPDRLTLFAALLLYDPRIEAARRAVTWRCARRPRRTRWAPSFSLSGQYSNDPTTEPWQGGIGANLPLDYGGQRKARLGRADVAVLIARHDLAETIWAERMAARRPIDLRLADRAPLLERQAIARRGAGRRLGAGGGGREHRAGTGCGAHRRPAGAARWPMGKPRGPMRAPGWPPRWGCRPSRWQVDFAWEDFADPARRRPCPIALAGKRARPRRCAARGGRL
jgi:CRISPR system Cascade subunit CasA